MSNSSFYDFQVLKAGISEPIALKSYQGKVCLVVNVASRCGFAPQYEGLQKLYLKYKAHGFEILAFPCNQFASQEPGNDKAIKNFCQMNYQITFDLFQKIDVNGKSAHPLYVYLTQAKKGFLGTKAIKWNFTKFLVGSDGQILQRFAPVITPEKLEPYIERALSLKE